MREVAQHALRIQKVLEDANLKVASVLSNILGKSGRAMLAALLAGETDPERLAALAHGTARQKHAALVEALRATSRPITAPCSRCTCSSSMRSRRPSPTSRPPWKSLGADPAADPPSDDDAGHQ